MHHVTFSVKARTGSIAAVTETSVLNLLCELLLIVVSLKTNILQVKRMEES